MYAFIIGTLNSVIKGIAFAISYIILLFPNSPFSEPSAPPSSVNLGYITWVFDFPTWLLHLSLILVAVGVYYTVRIGARWVKAVRS